jgi:crotonobetainyl-CoA:carnitine CoA-transferase CaiB-like acyl-CoA transferase
MQKPLEGIRVLEWGIFHAGPGGPAILSDMGADVIKIEKPGTGDPIRQVSQYKNIDFNLGASSNMFFQAANRGKKSVTIDLARSEGRQLAYDLVEKSDVFFTNIRSSTVERMKMDYPTLSEINPSLIYATVTSYGSQGPDADQGGFDFQGQGRAGLMYSLGEPNMSPGLAQFGIADQTTAIMASYQVVIALLMRERFGIGQKVEVSLLGAVSYIMYMNNLTALLAGRDVPRHEQASADPLRNYYCCKDAKWLVLTDHPKSENWSVICELIGHTELIHNPDFKDRESRMQNSKELVAIFNKAFLTRTRDEWLDLFKEKNLIICQVNTSMEAVKDIQMKENGYIVDFDHPEMGKISIPGFPIQFSRAEINNNLVAPKLGEHTFSVLKGVNSYSDEYLEKLRKDKII